MIAGVMANKKDKPKRGPGRPPKDGVPRPRNVDRHKMPRESFHLPPELQAALLAYLEAASPAPDKSEVLRVALRRFLEGEGFWPPPA
jgi:hypothetical protein